MRNNLAVATILFTLFVSGLWAQSDRGTATVTIGGKKISIEYGRPSLKGRDMLSKLSPGSTWRMGMNAATMLTTEARLAFGDKTVEPGSYRLTAKRVTEDEWHLVVNSDQGNIEVPLSHLSGSDTPVETFTIELSSKGGNKGTFSMSWGTLALATNFTAQGGGY